MPENGFNEGFINPSIITANSTRPGLMNNQVTPPAGSIVGRPGDPSPSPLNFLGKLGNILNPFSSLISGGLSAVANYFGQKQQIKAEKEMAQEQRDWNEKMFERQNEINDANWQRETEYNSPVNQVNRLMDAGLNPLAVGLDGNSGAGMVNAPQALGYDRASLGNMQNPIAAGFSSGIQAASLQKDLELKNAQIDKLKSDTTGVELDNEWKDKTMQARIESENLKNQLTDKEIKELDERIKLTQQDIKKRIAETKSEEQRCALMAAEEMLTNAKTTELYELLPYHKLLLQAQTFAQRQAGLASYYNAMYQKGLLDSGYIDKMCESIDAEIRLKNANADAAIVRKELDQWKIRIKEGHAFEKEEWEKSGLGKHISWKTYINGLLQFTSIASEAALGSIISIGK